jgi:hypothetical protein
MVVLAVGVLAMNGCSSPTPKVSMPMERDPSGKLVAAPMADLPAAALREPVPKARSAKLLEKAGQISPFCDVEDRLDHLKEPVPTDLAKSLAYARLYYALLRTLNPDQAWPNPRRRTAAGAPKRLQLTDAEKDALRIERAQIYAYLVRVQATKQFADAKVLAPEQVRARLRDAFVKLADGPYTDADDVLTRFADGSCKP